MAERFRIGSVPANTVQPGSGSDAFPPGILVWADQSGRLFSDTSGPGWDSTLKSLNLPGNTTVSGALHVVGVTITNGSVTVNAGADVNPTTEGQGLGVRTTAGNPLIFAHSTGTTGRVALFSTGGTQQRPGYATTGTTGRTMASTVTPAAVYSSLVGAQLNALQSVVMTLIQDLSGTTGLGILASTV